MSKVTVQPGDTLSHIALRELGSASRWPEIFAINWEAIDKAQHLPQRRNMRGPDWIFPGTVLQLPARRAEIKRDEHDWKPSDRPYHEVCTRCDLELRDDDKFLYPKCRGR